MTAISARNSYLPVLSRPRAVVAAPVVALVGNLLLWLIGLAAGGSFELTDDGTSMAVAPGGVVTLTVIPMVVGMVLAALISLRWLAILRIAQVIGVIAPLGTIALTFAADFDAPSTITLALMHVVVAIAVASGLESMRMGAEIRAAGLRSDGSPVR